jgi:MFS family permease
MVLGMQMQNVILIGFIEIVLAIMAATIQGVATPYFTEIFPAQVRASGCSIGFGFGASLSGFSPMIAAATMGWLGPRDGLIILLLAVSLIGFMLATIIPNNKVEMRRKQSTGKLPSGGDVEVN